MAEKIKGKAKKISQSKQGLIAKKAADVRNDCERLIKLVSLDYQKEQRIMQAGFAATIPIREEAFSVEELRFETRQATSLRQCEAERISQVNGYEPALGGYAIPGDMFQDPKRNF